MTSMLRTLSYVEHINAWNSLWNSSTTNDKGRKTEEFLLEKNLNICNKLLRDLNFSPLNTTFVDVTVAGEGIIGKIETWRFLSQTTFSDHPYIYFTIDLLPGRKPHDKSRLPKLEELNTSMFKHLVKRRLSSLLDPKSKREIYDAIEKITSMLRSSAFEFKVNIPKATIPTFERVLRSNRYFTNG